MLKRIKFLAPAFASVLLLSACDDGGAAGEGTFPVDNSEVVGTITGETGIYQDIVFGDPNAPVTLLEYGSMTCGACANFKNMVYPDIEKKYVDSGKVKFIFRNYVLGGQLDLVASSVARCTTEDVARALTKEFFAKQGRWLRSDTPVDDLAALARRAGISRVQFDQCIRDKDMQKYLAEMTKEGGSRMGVTGTPTLYVNGKKLSSYAPEVLEEALEAELN